MRAIVTGMLATYPVGGVAWDYGQYALGLERLGFEVFYLEDTGISSYTYNPQLGGYQEDCTYGVQFLEESLAKLSPTLARRWHYRAVDDRTYGIDAATFEEIVSDADLLLNVSGGSVLREPYRRCARKLLIDTDPGWNHFVIFPRWDAKPPAEHNQGFRGHDYFFTYAERLGRDNCPLASFGLDWQATRPPVVRDCWKASPPASSWTTVMMWNNYQRPIVHDGVTYGSKELEFGHIEAIPSRSPAEFEVAINGDAPREHWRQLGWSVVEGSERSRTAGSYQAYIESSRGEFSVAKNIYVATRCGWFSCRSVCYLAAGLPVVVQETGFSDVIPTGSGLLAFSDLDQAVQGIDTVERAYSSHQAAARELARDYFDSDRVLGEMLHRIGLS